jgi:hypothetical protein
LGGSKRQTQGEDRVSFIGINFKSLIELSNQPQFAQQKKAPERGTLKNQTFPKTGA